MCYCVVFYWLEYFSRCVRRCIVGVFFFFKQKTAYEMRISDWSSDVCSSDLGFEVAAFAMSVLLVFLDPTWIKFLFNSHLNLGLSFRGLKQSIYLLNRAQDAQLIASGRLAPLCSIFRLSKIGRAHV